MESISLQTIYNGDLDEIINRIKNANKLKEFKKIQVAQNELFHLELHIAKHLAEKCVKLYKTATKLGCDTRRHSGDHHYEQIHLIKNGDLECVKLDLYSCGVTIEINMKGEIVYCDEGFKGANELEYIQFKIELCQKFINDFKRFENQTCKEINRRFNRMIENTEKGE